MLNLNMLSLSLIVIAFLATRVNSVLPANHDCSNINANHVYGSIDMQYYEVLIDIRLYCMLSESYDTNGLTLDAETINEIETLQSKFDGDCFGDDYSLADVRSQWYIDSRLDFPNNQLEFSDKLRSRILRCFDTSKVTITSKDVSCNNFVKSRMDIIRDTIDHYAGFTRANIRPLRFRPVSCSSINGDLAVTTIRSKKEMYLSSINIKDSEENLDGRSLQFVVTDPASVALLGSMAAADIQSLIAETSSSIFSQLSYGGIISTISTLSSVIGLIKSFHDSSSNHNAIVEERLLNIEKNSLESRKLFLIQMENMINEQKATNLWLEEISGQMNVVITILNNIEQELADINAQLEKVNKQIGDVKGLFSNGTSPDIQTPDFGPDSSAAPVGRMPNPITLSYDDIIEKYKDLGCDSFKDYKILYQEVTFMIFYLRLRRNTIDMDTYRKYRFNSADSVAPNTYDTEVFHIGGRHPEFSAKYYDLEEKMNDWVKGKSDLEIESAEVDMLPLFEVLADRLRVNFRFSEVRNFYNDLYMSASHHDTSIYNYLHKYLGSPNLCNLY